MTLEQIEAFLNDESRTDYGDIEWLRSRLHYHEHLTKDLMAVAKAAKQHVEHWNDLASHDMRTSILLRTTFDPSYKPGDRLGLHETLERWEKE